MGHRWHHPSTVEKSSAVSTPLAFAYFGDDRMRTSDFTAAEESPWLIDYVEPVGSSFAFLSFFRSQPITFRGRLFQTSVFHTTSLHRIHGRCQLLALARHLLGNTFAAIDTLLSVTILGCYSQSARLPFLNAVQVWEVNFLAALSADVQIRGGAIT
jgi:hypothetical protein